MITAKYVPDVPREQIIDALERFDSELRDSHKWKGWEGKRNHKYAIKYEDRLYPEKEIIILATGASRNSFAGGPEAISYLEERGFTVVHLRPDINFQFGENDFSERVAGTTWRGQLSEILKQNLAGITGGSIGGGAVYGRHELLFHDKRYDKKFIHPKLSFNLDVEDRTCDFGFYIEKGYAESEDPAEVMDGTWAWHSLVHNLEDEEFIGQLKEVLVSNDLEIALELWGPDETLMFRPKEDDLQMTRLADGSAQAFSWEQFVDYLKSIPASQWCDFYVRRVLMIGDDRKISLEPVLDTFKGVVHLYYSVLTDGPQAEVLYLLGATKERDEVVPLESFFNENGRFASWWSYPVRDEYQDLIRENLPLTFLLYQGGELFIEWTITDFITSHGSEGIISPWPEYTLEEERDRTKMGGKASEICKTWFLVEGMNRLDPPESLNDYVYYESGEAVVPQFLINSFGYVKQREPEPGGAGELNEIYKYFADGGFHFPNEVITNYVIALKTKPFVILSGISGTGKTKIAQIFAEFMCPPEKVMVSEAPENEERAFYVKVGKQLYKYSELNVTAQTVPYFDIPERGQSENLMFEFGDTEMPMRLTNVGFTEPAKYGQQLFVYLKKEAMNWVRENFSLGDFMKVTVLGEDLSHYQLEKYEPEERMLYEKRMAFISVRPDWIDNRGLLGFYNLLTSEYQPTELLKLMLKAKDDPERPYFVVLDEMNLAKVEYYFSDFLSCMESRVLRENGVIEQEPAKLHDQEEEIEFTDSEGRTYFIPPSLEIPSNVYFTGTVNVDETAYMFSPKVLDRANTIEFNEVDLSSYGRGEPPSTGSAFKLNKEADVRLLFGQAELATDTHFRSLQDSMKSYLEDLNDILKPHHMHFGYRVANEISLYVKNAVEQLEPGNEVLALDLQILQKVLPKFHGSRQRLEKPLLQLLEFCFGDEVASEPEFDTLISKYDDSLEDAYFPRTAAKIIRMLKTLGEQGFVSFVE